VAHADGVGELGDAEESLGRESADHEDELGPDQPELPLPPERAELLLAGVGVRSPSPEAERPG
jgi:hypothetical protein